MAKRKQLTKKQKRQVGKNLSKRLNESSVLPTDDSLLAEQMGLVVGRFGQHADVRNEQDQILRCHIRRTIESVVCGDNVLFRQNKEDNASIQGVIEAVEERQSLLSRPDFYDGIKPVAANIDQILIVSSILPAFSSNIVDRYLVAAEDVEITPIILINKIDLLEDDMMDAVQEAVERYQALGYKVIQLSCKSGEGVDLLAQQLNHKTSVFVGQSGVGKSSLVNALLPESEEAIGDISETSGLGQHTTTSAKLLRFSTGGQLIDSPGVREFALWHLPADRVTWCFKEFRAYIGGCKFRDCKHADDPGCLLKKAVEQGEISSDRFENYHSILKSMEEQRPAFSTPPRK